jgi:pimeloyl-ACP methyl ester carboxylesterase
VRTLSLHPYYFSLKKYLILACRYFHGLLGSRLESNFDAHASLVHGILFISVDRPGYGLSTYSPKRSYLDFVEDVEQLLNYLALPKVLVIGFSSGGPYALACAARIPERLIGCSVVSSDLPYADLSPELVKELKGDLKSLNTVFNVAKVLRCSRLPLLLPRHFHRHTAVQWVIPTALKVSTRKAYSSSRDFAVSICTGADAGSLLMPFLLFCLLKPCLHTSVLLSPEHSDLRFELRCTLSFREGQRGGFQAAAQEVRMERRPWGFGLHECKIMNVHVWHGTADQCISEALAKELAKQCRGTFHSLPDKGHTSAWFLCWKQIINEHVSIKADESRLMAVNQAKEAKSASHVSAAALMPSHFF